MDRSEAVGLVIVLALMAGMLLGVKAAERIHHGLDRVELVR